jgi:signal transduction histidine kinase
VSPSAAAAPIETQPPRIEEDLPDDAKAATAAEPPRAPAVRDWVTPLADEIREPLRAIRTYANLLEQRPDDEHVRQQLAGLVEGDLSRVEQTLQRLERFAALGAPQPEPVDLAALVGAELDQRQSAMRARSLVVLRELEPTPAPAIVDPEQLRFAIGALLDRALRMVPEGGDLYVGSSYQPVEGSAPAGHRLLLRFHSPEDVLVSPEDSPGPGTPIEVVLARELIDRMGGASAVDASGSQDNVILIELPA